jgi:large subunit ribosomal protein L24
MNIRKGDIVLVITGPYKGRRGRVLRALPKKNRLVVEGVNMIKKHMRPTNRNQQGGIVEREAPIHVSNVVPWNETTKEPSKIVRKRLEDGSRVRMYRKTGETLQDQR